MEVAHHKNKHATKGGFGQAIYERNDSPSRSSILMAEKAKLNDPEIKKLADEIISSQQAEIEQMKTKLNELKK